MLYVGSSKLPVRNDKTRHIPLVSDGRCHFIFIHGYQRGIKAKLIVAA